MLYMIYLYNLSIIQRYPCIVQPVGLPVQVMAYLHYPYQVLPCISIIKDAATPHADYPRRGMQQSRVTGRQLAPAKLHVIHRLTDEPVTGCINACLARVSADCGFVSTAGLPAITGGRGSVTAVTVAVSTGSFPAVTFISASMSAPAFNNISVIALYPYRQATCRGAMPVSFAISGSAFC